MRGATWDVLLPVSDECISIHAPREGCDPLPTRAVITVVQFQSTHPVRGATRSKSTTSMCAMRFQSTHPVRGATYNAMQTADKVDISIHAPREGCDGLAAYAAQGDYQFQSTHPVRGATPESTMIAEVGMYFNPRTP